MLTEKTSRGCNRGEDDEGTDQEKGNDKVHVYI